MLAALPDTPPAIHTQVIAGQNMVTAAEAQRYLNLVLTPLLRTQIAAAPVPTPVLVGDVTCDNDIPADGLRHASCHLLVGGVSVRVKLVALYAAPGHVDVQESLDQDVLFSAVIQSQLAQSVVQTFPNSTIVCPFKQLVNTLEVGEETVCTVVGANKKTEAAIFLHADTTAGSVSFTTVPL
jgi:hypothetical protein